MGGEKRKRRPDQELLLCRPFITDHNTGPLIGRGKKVKFHGIFRDKFAEKTADFAGISRKNSGQISPKNDR